MKTLYLDCGMGAAGDMLAAALLALLPDPEAVVEKLNSLGLPGVSISWTESVKCGVRGFRFSVKINGAGEDAGLGHGHHGHSHSTMEDIDAVISALPVSDRVRADAAQVYRLIAQAEGSVHGRPVEAVHFHEVGALDAVADIVSVSLLMERLAPDRVVVSPVCVGSGQVECAHGILPVPAPATERLLRGIPSFGGAVRGEMCTPTGAALLKHFAMEFGTMPVMRTEAVGYGMGGRDYGAVSCVRAFWGTEQGQTPSVAELKCNLDDMTPEAVGFAMERLFENGALDVYTVPVGMKKSRPGIQLCCLCRQADTEKLANIMLRHTSTLGIRVSYEQRFTLDRSTVAVQTEYGPVRLKKAGSGGILKLKPEYEDLARIARENDLTLDEAAALIKRGDAE